MALLCNYLLLHSQLQTESVADRVITASSDEDRRLLLVLTSKMNDAMTIRPTVNSLNE